MEQGNINIYEKLMIFYRRKWMLIIPFFIGITLASLTAYLLPAYYRSTTLILVEAQQIPDTYVKSTNMSPIEEQLNTIKQQVMSRTKLEEIIGSFNLYKKEDSNKIRWNSLLKVIGIGQSGILSKEDKVEIMRKDIEVDVIKNTIGFTKRDGGADAFSISYTSSDPKTAQHVTSNLASFFIDENLKIREQYAEGTSEFISSELEKAKHDLEEQEKKIKDFKEKNIGVLPEQLEANLRTLDRLQIELQNIHGALKNAEDKKLFLESQIGNITSLGEVSENKLMEDELLKLKSELSSLLTIYKETFPDVVMLKGRISEIEKQLANVKETAVQETAVVVKGKGGNVINIHADLAAAKSQIDALRMRETKTRKQIGDFEKRVETIPSVEQWLADLRRNYDISLENYKSLLSKKLSASLSENLEKRQKGEKFRVIDPANLPEKPYKPNRMKIVLLGTIIGLGIGIGLVYFTELMNPAFQKPEDFEGVLTQPVLTVIPLYSVKIFKEKGVKNLRVIKSKRV